jgi:hypothetical protein
MIDQSALEQGSVTYQEIVAEGKRLVDALKELAGWGKRVGVLRSL